MTSRFRPLRFRSIDIADQLLLPPPLPLIQLPVEVRLASTGIPDERPSHLPVRRHIECQGVSRGDRPPPEPVLAENRLVLEQEAADYEEREVVNRIAVYEYNRPEVFQYSGAPDDTLVFDSLFESGNLQRADRVFRSRSPSSLGPQQASQEYELVIHPDVKNSAYRQWFYFEVRNGRPGVTYRFSLVNLAKSGALFGSCLQPVVYSERSAETRQEGWVHAGTHVRYGPRDDSAMTASPLVDDVPGPPNNSLSFQYRFEHESDCVYFACIQPYTYTDLMEYLERLEKDPQRAQTFRRTELCQTIAQNSCDMLTITSSGKQVIPQEDRQIVVLSARVHPGEPNSSWMIKGMIDYLTGPSAGATVLRRNFVFKVVPMLNPDGVVNGNTRVNLAGWDLNRKWASPVEKLFPTVFHLKRQLASYQSRGRVAIYCDLHGHSISRNIFTYGCYSLKTSGTSSISATATEDLRQQSKRFKNDPRVFPMIVARHSAFFSFGSCDFKVQRSKLTTARVVVHHELGVTNSYTLEASFCGPDFGPRKDTQFSTWDLEDMGRSWCQSLLVYFSLAAEVKELEAERDRELAAQSKQQERQREAGTRREEGEDEQLLAILLDDYEAAISELFSQSQLDEDEDVDSGFKAGSDLSDAEEEPIPPSVGGGGDGIGDRATAADERKRSRKKKVRKKKKKRSSSRADKQHGRKSSDGRLNPRGGEDGKVKARKKKSKAKRKVAGEEPGDKGAESDTGGRSSRKKKPVATRAKRSKSLRAIPGVEAPRVLPLPVSSAVSANGTTAVKREATPTTAARLPYNDQLVLPSVVDGANAPRRLWTAPVGESKDRVGQTSARERLELPALAASRACSKFETPDGDEEEKDDDEEEDEDDEVSDGDASDASVQSEPPEAYRLAF